MTDLNQRATLGLPIMLRRLGPKLLGAVPPILIVVVWWVAVRAHWAPPYALPSPEAVVSALRRTVSEGQLLANTRASFERLGASFLLGATAAIVLGLLIGRSSAADRFFSGPINFFQSIGGIAWVPVAIVWFGLGTPAVVFVVANIIFFVVLQSTVLGVRSVSRLAEDMVLTLGGRRRDVLREVVIPGTLVSALVGVRIGLAYGWRALIGAELVVASDGLGFYTLQASSRLETATVIAAILVIGALWLAIDKAVLATIERKTIGRWGLVDNSR